MIDKRKVIGYVHTYKRATFIKTGSYLSYVGDKYFTLVLYMYEVCIWS